MINYVNPLPNDKNQNALQEFPAPKLAKATYTKENATASSVISVTQDTTSIEVTAGGGPVVVKWIATTDTAGSVITAATGANYDHVIPTDDLRRFAIPREAQGSYASSVQGANRAEGLYRRVAIKSFGIASVLLTEY